MKQYLRLTLLILFVSSGLTNLHAQVTLTQANVGLQAGDQFQVYDITVPNASSLFYYSDSRSGNQTWDFSQAVTSGLKNASILSRISAPNPAGFPSANAVLDFRNGPFFQQTFSYIENSGSFSREVGTFQQSPGWTINYTNAFDRMRFPFTFNDTYTDTFTGDYVHNGDSCVRFGYITVIADGYGDIITPAGTFNNVLRVKTIEFANDSCPPNLSHIGTSQFTTTYDWYAPGIHFPVFRVLEYHVMLAIFWAGFYLDPNYVGLKEDDDNLLNFQVYPNPAEEEITVTFDLIHSGAAKISVVNMLGQLVKKIEPVPQNATNHTLKLDVSTYPKGIYSIQLQASDKMAIRKLIVR